MYGCTDYKLSKMCKTERSTGLGMEAIEGLRFLASLPLAGTGRTEGGEKTQPFKRFHSHLFTHIVFNPEVHVHQVSCVFYAYFFTFSDIPISQYWQLGRVGPIVLSAEYSA